MARPALTHLVEHADGGADLPWRAIATLVPVMANEGGLQRVQVLGRAQAFDRHDLVILMHHGKAEAAVDAATVDKHRARTTLSVVAPLLAAGQTQVFAAQVQQGCADVGLGGVGLAIDREVQALSRKFRGVSPLR
ncbi:hypothetical protein NOVOSPHI9U_60098 [Novosphingobium sp. 9U]|nr:hypothetical protein NOVOSPHI9U_60098 [Novosphingobium sp. 9U]